MNKELITPVIFVSLLFCFFHVHAQYRTKEIIEYIKWIEANSPEEKGWEEKMSNVIEIVQELEFDIVINASLTSPLIYEEGYLYHKELAQLFLLNSIEYCIRNKTYTDIEANIAGIKGMLQYYKFLKTKKPEEVSLVMEGYEKMDRDSTMDSYINRQMMKLGEKDSVDLWQIKDAK